MLLRFIKNWTLPLAMIVGTVAYFFFAKISFLAPLKPCVNGLVAVLTPFLIFAQLLLTFCKVEVRDLKPKTWHGWLLLFRRVLVWHWRHCWSIARWTRCTGRFLKVRWCVSYALRQLRRPLLPVSWVVALRA